MASAPRTRASSPKVQIIRPCECALCGTNSDSCVGLCTRSTVLKRGLEAVDDVPEPPRQKAAVVPEPAPVDDDLDLLF